MRFTVNSIEVEPTEDPQTSLLDFLRERLHLTGTKSGCGTGHCGACVVLLDGEPVRSCHFPLKKADGHHIDTIEGLAAGGGLHAVQAAFLATGAVQCGFCTPGMILSAKSLLERVPAPTDEQIRTALQGNLCRCTGYVKILEAVHLASDLMAGRPPTLPASTAKQSYPGVASACAGSSADSSFLGLSWPDHDGRAKVTGELVFAGDLAPAECLHGRPVLSDHPYAEVLAVRVEAAQAVPGVRKVLTAADVPGHNGMGSLVADQPVLCGAKVSFTGDAVAVVFADTAEAAKSGAEAVEVEYRPLPGSFTPAESLAPGAPRLNEGGNVCKHLIHEVGDAAAALDGAALVLEGHFETPFVEHGYLEPEAGVAWIDEGGAVVVQAPTQFPFELRRQIAAMLSLPEEQVRVVATPLGGGFGSKLDNTVEGLLALGAYHLRRPVKLVLTRAESLRMSTKRHPYSMDYRVGLDKEGHILAVDARLLSDAGPYTALSPRVIDQACLFSCGPYRVQNVRVEGWAVHTNNANASAFRGFGINQAAVAIESLLDEGARSLGIDPIELRLRNALEVGDTTISGETLRAGVTTRATLETARAALAEEQSWIDAARAQGRSIGVGVASGFKNVGAGKGKVDDAGAIYTLQADGTVELRASAIDMGQGIRTALLQIAAEILELSPECFRIVTGDTALTIKHGGAVGERQVLISGRAVELGAREFKDRLLAEAGLFLGAPVGHLVFADGVVRAASGGSLSLRDLAGLLEGEGRSLETSFTYVAPKTYALADQAARLTVPRSEYRNYPAYAYATQVAVVEVHRDSGRVEVLEIIAAHDCGRAINPQKIEGQIEGSCLMGLGYALSEEYPLEQGRPRARTMGALGLPTFRETPKIRCLLIEDPEPEGPFGAKGISEVATVPATPAILNAIYDAVGVRVTSLPASRGELQRGSREGGETGVRVTRKELGRAV